jgi:Flp pilus assembly protein TadD
MSYEKVVDIQPDEPKTNFNIVVAYIAKEDYSGAVVWAEKHANINPTDPRAWQLLARCYSEVGEKDKAREALKRFEMLNKQGDQ